MALATISGRERRQAVAAKPAEANQANVSEVAASEQQELEATGSPVLSEAERQLYL
ncbi:hypothetical protein FRC00_009773, partial [Tulasnella sp. 408]